MTGQGGREVSTIRRVLGWLYGPPRSPLGVVRYAAVYVSQGLLLALLLIPLPNAVVPVVVIVIGAYFLWQASPYIGQHSCEVCGTRTDILPVMTEEYVNWVPWRRTVLRWMCPTHWHEDLLLRAWMAHAAAEALIDQEDKDRPGG